jgi:hypothetical protein
MGEFRDMGIPAQVVKKNSPRVSWRNNTAKNNSLMGAMMSTGQKCKNFQKFPTFQKKSIFKYLINVQNFQKCRIFPKNASSLYIFVVTRLRPSRKFLEKFKLMFFSNFSRNYFREIREIREVIFLEFLYFDFIFHVFRVPILYTFL